MLITKLQTKQRAGGGRTIERGQRKTTTTTTTTKKKKKREGGGGEEEEGGGEEGGGEEGGRGEEEGGGGGEEEKLRVIERLLRLLDQTDCVSGVLVLSTRRRIRQAIEVILFLGSDLPVSGPLVC
ncbi:LOW QUALITY PROTEIN: hypothetical protein ElyMa_006824700 [Elysia marginata]|uniref:Uncharacterized protein n=1 Tax=Elysia marginata TaxID=1093978 RepID=A0AAV4J7T8_9GAST|nr:LOW QUALITY PROTEIN: hypothetical protein ElyMa_006824700 [Elysia marginata]